MVSGLPKDCGDGGKIQRSLPMLAFAARGVVLWSRVLEVVKCHWWFSTCHETQKVRG